MVELLPKWNLYGNKHSFYEADSVTLIELASQLTGTMNALIDEYNRFAERVNTQVEEFMQATEKDQETFETALRQEFQDFIDVIDMKFKELGAIEALPVVTESDEGSFLRVEGGSWKAVKLQDVSQEGM